MKKKPVHGFGVNDANYTINPLFDGKRVMCEAYKSWMAMLKRCHSKPWVEQYKSYDGVTVCEEWRSFMAFRKWWLENHVDGWWLDKDLLTDNRQYSPDNCIYIPRWLSVFYTDGNRVTRSNPTGVSNSAKSGVFLAKCNNPKTGLGELLGEFSTQSEAHQAWKSKKIEHAMSLRESMDSIDNRIYPRIIEIIKRTN